MTFPFCLFYWFRSFSHNSNQNFLPTIHWGTLAFPGRQLFTQTIIFSSWPVIRYINSPGCSGCFLNFLFFFNSSHISSLKMFKVPTVGPGCTHFWTCSLCLTAPSFMNCGWCSGRCSRKHECTSQWNNYSCTPVITQVAQLVSNIYIKTFCHTEIPPWLCFLSFFF